MTRHVAVLHGNEESVVPRSGGSAAVAPYSGGVANTFQNTTLLEDSKVPYLIRTK